MVTFMLKAVVDVEEAKAANATLTIAKMIIAKATEKVAMAVAVAVASPSEFTSQVQRSLHLSKRGIPF